MSQTVYKICARAAWEAAVREGVFTGSADDLRDGYIHLSTGDQLAETVARHFTGLEDLLLIAVDSGRLGGALQWEPARGGALFPHLYGALPVEAVRAVIPLPPRPGGGRILPEGFLP